MEEDHHHHHQQHHNQELRFVCKQCNKRYPCGKSLGGHMRSHVIAANSAELDDKIDPQILKKVQSLSRDHQQQQQQQSRFEHGGYSSYGLRENPKKTWRATVGSNNNNSNINNNNLINSQEKACKQCGKVFQSLKALCGHMACHSDKDRNGLKDDHSWSSESKKLDEIDSEDDDDDDEDEDEEESDTEAEDHQQMMMITREKSSANPKRYKKIVVKSSSFTLANNNNNSVTNNNNNNNSFGSSSVSEIDEQEQEEVAKCLMMLSKDSGNWNGVSSVVEFSDNNSVVLETKSSSIDMKSSRKDNGLCKVYNRDEKSPTKGTEKDRKLESKSNIVDTELVESQSSDSGYFLGENKVESDVSVNGFLASRNYNNDKFLNRTKGYMEQPRSYNDYGKQKRTINDAAALESGSFKKMKLGSSSAKKKYECLNCKKSFNSYQALGGHRPCHKKTNADVESSYGTGENSLDADETYNNMNKTRESFGSKKTSVKDSSDKKIKPKKGKGHECPFCHRVFKSGQALGGHKRSHFIGGAQVINSSQAPVVTKAEAPDLLDLNLPAPVEDEDDDHMMSW